MYFQRVNAVWSTVFTLELQQLFDEFEFICGQAALPISYKMLKEVFTHVSEEKIQKYHAAVRECKRDIDLIQRNNEDDSLSLQVTAKQRLQQLSVETTR